MLAVNSLGKVPVLVLPDGFAMFDSTVICEYLDGLHNGSRLVPDTGPPRWAALRLQAPWRRACANRVSRSAGETERRPPGLRYQPLADGMAMKLIASYDFAEHDEALDAPLHIGQIALATALDWLAFRALADFRPGRQRLTAWYESFRERKSMRATSYAGETRD